MADRHIQVHHNKGQFVINYGKGTQNVTQNIYHGHEDQWGQLYQRLEQLLNELKRTDQLDGERKEEAVEYIDDVLANVKERSIKKGSLRKLNKELMEMKGLISASSALGQCISAVMDIISTILKAYHNIVSFCVSSIQLSGMSSFPCALLPKT
ncbi:hypothetical protein JQC72_02145 [Polycladomyces sp. WAk]|uniref:Uncharacterized protein n=1 Tax=Polycladomyces zharkentensis TaxID=2807616 RepID=A0ABS2WFL2_9BACL|nr:hypothetical protein [Polycladomyces sp. WAk]MBN2908321.1 hypothetical protein [Polycladomyces sp. WAk]